MVKREILGGNLSSLKIVAGEGIEPPASGL